MTSSPEPTLATDWASAWACSEQVPGWLTRDQARVLWDLAAAVPPEATIVEIGSHQGRSTIVLAAAARARSARVVAIDPFVAGRMFGGSATRDRFEHNLAHAGVRDSVDLRVTRSSTLRPGWPGRIDLLYIDGKHDYWTVRDDLRWAEHVREGGAVAVHDCFSSIGVTLAVLVHVLPGSRLRYAGRTGSLARFEVAGPAWRDRLRILAALPWFARNVAIKLVLRVARLFGSTRPDPY